MLACEGDVDTARKTEITSHQLTGHVNSTYDEIHFGR